MFQQNFVLRFQHNFVLMFQQYCVLMFQQKKLLMFQQKWSIQYCWQLMCTSINLEHFVRSLTFDGIVHFAYVCQGVANMNLCPILAHPVFDQGVQRQIETSGACDLVHCTLQVSYARHFWRAETYCLSKKCVCYIYIYIYITFGGLRHTLSFRVHYVTFEGLRHILSCHVWRAHSLFQSNGKFASLLGIFLKGDWLENSQKILAWDIPKTTPYICSKNLILHHQNPKRHPSPWMTDLGCCKSTEPTYLEHSWNSSLP